MTYDYDLSFFTITSQPSSEKLAWTCIFHKKRTNTHITVLRFPHNICSACNANTNENWKTGHNMEIFWDIYGLWEASWQMMVTMLWICWPCHNFSFYRGYLYESQVKKPTSASIQYSTKWSTTTKKQHVQST